jgi:hypothetical protein
MAPTLNFAHGVLKDAREKGQIPLTLNGLQEAASWAREQILLWEDQYDRVVVVGEPGALDGVLGLASLGNSDRIRCVNGPDAAQITSAFDDTESPLLLVIAGPIWVISLAQGIAPEKAAVTVISGDGTGESPVGLSSDWGLVETAWAVDARFGRLSGLGLALAGWAGLDLERILYVATEQLKVCERSEMMQNPAYLLSALVQGFEEDLDLQGMLGLVPLGSQAHWARGLCNLWSSMTARRGQGPQQISSMGATSWMLPGDEAAVQGLLGGSERRWSWTIWSEEMPADMALGPRESVWSMCRSLMRAQIQQLVESGCPVIRLRLARMEAEQLVSVDVLFLVAAMTLGALRGYDPLAMPAADRLRELHNGSIVDNGG